MEEPRGDRGICEVACAPVSDVGVLIRARPTCFKVISFHIGGVRRLAWFADAEDSTARAIREARKLGRKVAGAFVRVTMRRRLTELHANEPRAVGFKLSNRVRSCCVKT